MDEFGFLKPWFDPNEVYVLTSPTNRTSMSAQAFMQGMFIPKYGPKIETS